MLADVLAASLEKSRQGCAILTSDEDDPGGAFRIVYTNSAWYTNLTDGDSASLQPPFLPPALDDLVRQWAASGEGYHENSEVYVPSVGKWVRCEILAPDAKHIVLLLQDITGARKKKSESQSYQRQYKLIFENSQLGIFRYDAFGVIIEANDAFVDIMGSTREKLIGLKIFSLPDERVRNAVEYSLRGEKVRVFLKYKSVTSGKEVHVNCFFSPLNEDGRVTGGFAIVRDVTERLRIQRELEDNEANLNYAQRLARMGSWEATIYGQQLHWSENYYRLLGLEPFSVPPENDLFFSRVHPDDLHKFDLDTEYMQHSPYTKQLEFRLVFPDGSVKWLKNTIEPVFDGDKLVRLKGVNIDITELKTVQLELERSLHDKDVLLSEVHHRVKNNLAIISSLLQLQTDYIADGEIRSLLVESVNRVQSMALIHELIYRQESFASLHFDDFLSQFTRILHEGFSNSRQQVEVRLKTGHIALDIDRAIPLSLIANELLTNAYKHAFAGREHGEIFVELTSGEGYVELVIADDGVGLPSDFSLEGGTTLGSSLILGLAQQLNAQLEYTARQGGGSRFQIRLRAGSGTRN